MTALERIVARRIWFVPGVMVYGSADNLGFGMLSIESISGQTGVFYQSIEIGEDRQIVRFDSLTDHRGNRLPSTISAPRVIPRSRCEYPVFVTGPEADESFALAKSPSADGPVTVDLLIVELGA